MKPLVRAAVAFFVLAGQGAVGQVVTRTQVPEVRLNVGPVAPAVNPAAGSGALGSMNSGMSFSGSVLSLRGGRIQETIPDLPVSEVPSLTAPGVPAPGVALPLPAGGTLGTVQTPAGLPGAPLSEGGALDPESPAMGQGSRGRLAGDASEGSSIPGFSEKAAAIGSHLKEAGRVSELGSEFAEGFGRKLTDLMVGSAEHRSGGLEDSGLPGPGGAASQAGVSGLSAPGKSDGSQAGAAAAEVGVDARVGSSQPGPSTILDEEFPGVGRVLMEVSALSLDLTQVFPARLGAVAAQAAAGASLDLIERTADPGSMTTRTEAGRQVLSPADEAADPDLAYPGGFGSFMASMGGAMATEGRGAIETSTVIPLELKPAPGGVRRNPSEESRPIRGFRSSRGFSTGSSSLPSVPLSLLSYALLPLFLAGLELRSRI